MNNITQATKHSGYTVFIPKSAKMSKPKIRGIYFDWKGSGIPEFKKAIKAFGLHLYTDPTMDGSDMYGFILSDQKLTKKQIKKQTRI